MLLSFSIVKLVLHHQFHFSIIKLVLYCQTYYPSSNSFPVIKPFLHHQIHFFIITFVSASLNSFFKLHFLIRPAYLVVVGAMFSKFRPAGHFVKLARSLPMHPPSLHRPLHSLTTKKFNHGDSVTLNLILPQSDEIHALECETTDELTVFVQAYKGVLAVDRKKGPTKIIPPSKYSKVTPSTTYKIISPFFASLDDERHHWQIADKAFEDRSRFALIQYLEDQKYSFRELDRVIKVGEDFIAEWEGIFELEGGEYWFLECKHCVSTVFYLINLRLTVI